MASKRRRTTSPPARAEPPSDIFRSESIEDRKSVFVGVFSPTTAAKALQDLPEFKSATHRIAAWRKPSRQQTLFNRFRVQYETGFDEDGEQWSGKRLVHVLESMDVAGAVVVARDYGGVNLGPIRFTHIETCAKQAIQNWIMTVEEAKRQEKEDKIKRLKTDVDAEREERATLEESLKDRDQSIFVLRGLLAEKKAALEGSGTPVPVTPSKPQDYPRMPMETLRKLDKARDKTIEFILQQIDNVEAELKEMVGSDGADSPTSSLDELFSTPAEHPDDGKEADIGGERDKSGLPKTPGIGAS